MPAWRIRLIRPLGVSELGGFIFMRLLSLVFFLTFALTLALSLGERGG